MVPWEQLGIAKDLPVLVHRAEMEEKDFIDKMGVGSEERMSRHSHQVGHSEGDDIFVAGPRQDTAKIEATLKKIWETRDQMIGAKHHDQKELHILNRTLLRCKDGLLFAAKLRHGREVVDELGLSRSKLATV